jgi:hypothetical protein
MHLAASLRLVYAVVDPDRSGTTLLSSLGRWGPFPDRRTNPILLGTNRRESLTTLSPYLPGDLRSRFVVTRFVVSREWNSAGK